MAEGLVAGIAGVRSVLNDIVVTGLPPGLRRGF
jgi:hypothetical protein